MSLAPTIGESACLQKSKTSVRKKLDGAKLARVAACVNINLNEEKNPCGAKLKKIVLKEKLQASCDLCYIWCCIWNLKHEWLCRGDLG